MLLSIGKQTSDLSIKGSKFVNEKSSKASPLVGEVFLTVRSGYAQDIASVLYRFQSPATTNQGLLAFAFASEIASVKHSNIELT